MEYRTNLEAISLSGIAMAMAQGVPYRDEFGREFLPTRLNMKREGPARRQGTFTKQRDICRRAMARLARVLPHAEIPKMGKIRSRYSSRRVNVQPRPVSASLAAWRKEQENE
jgi:hypothetical protein